MPSPEVRTRLAAEQAGLVRALAGQGNPPDGFDGNEIGIAARSLLNKRIRTVAHIWPRLFESLGNEKFRGAFLEFGREHPLPPSASPFDDGLAFVRWYASDHPLPDAARLELLAAEMTMCRVRIVRLSESRRWVVAARIPFVGVRRILL